MTTVSVIIPTYNRPDMLREAVLSVLAQTFTDYEVIVVDDGSTKISEWLAYLPDKRVAYISQPHAGRSRARNTGLGLAKGKYVAFLDDDDLWTADKLEKQVAALEQNPDVGMVYSCAICIDERGALTGQVYRAIDKREYLPLEIVLPTVMVRRGVLDVVGGFDTELDRFEDTDMWRRITNRYRVLAMPEVLCKLRTRDDNTLAHQDPAVILRNMNRLAQKAAREDVSRMGAATVGGRLAHLYSHYGMSYLAIMRDRQSARKFLWPALRSRPWHWRVYPFLALAYLDGHVLAAALWLRTRRHHAVV